MPLGQHPPGTYSLATDNLTRRASERHRKGEGKKAEVSSGQLCECHLERCSCNEDTGDTSGQMSCGHSVVEGQSDRSLGLLGLSSEPANCPYCGATFKQARNIQRHIDNTCKVAPKGAQVTFRSSQPDSSHSQATRENLPSTGSGIACPHCNIHLSQPHNLPRHLLSCPVVARDASLKLDAKPPLTVSVPSL